MTNEQNAVAAMIKETHYELRNDKLRDAINAVHSARDAVHLAAFDTLEAAIDTRVARAALDARNDIDAALVSLEMLVRCYALENAMTALSDSMIKEKI